MVAIKFIDKIEHDRLVLIHSCGPAAGGNGVDDFRADPLFCGERSMDCPLVVLAPFARNHENDEFRHCRANRRIVAKVVTHDTCRGHELRAADQYFEWTENRNISYAKEFLSGLSLRFVVFIRREGRQPIIGCGCKGESRKCNRADINKNVFYEFYFLL